jgi:hypothetical protein
LTPAPGPRALRPLTPRPRASCPRASRAAHSWLKARAPVLALLTVFAAWAAQAADVVSTKPDSVAVTIYRDGPASTRRLSDLNAEDTQGLALVVETRLVDLPAGRSRLRFEGVADGIIPQSAAAEGLPAPPTERDFDYDLLSPGALIAHSIGRRVSVVRTDARTGRETEEVATLASGPEGILLDFGDRVEALHCGGERERLIFDHAPPGLTDKPTLSLRVDVPAAGRFKVRLSYLTVRLDWSADYIARIDPDGRTLDLTGWITLANRGAAGFADAPTQVVAGHISRRPVETPAPASTPVAALCWPGQTTHAGWAERPRPGAKGTEVDEVVVSGQRAFSLFAPPPPPPPSPRVAESQLGDYKLYTLGEPTTVAARQTKQVLFLSQPAVKFETVYRHEVFDYDAARPVPPIAASVILRLENTSAQGLGRPLPAGQVNVRKRFPEAGGRELLVGDYPLARDVPVGEPLELAVGLASDVTVARTVTSVTPDGHGHVRRALEIRAANAKTTPVVLEIRHHRLGAPAFRVVAESLPHGLKSGDPLWRLAVPAEGEALLSYTVELDKR